ncbi:hypothetical protein Bca4012_102501 [Brassica carinata]
MALKRATYTGRRGKSQASMSRRARRSLQNLEARAGGAAVGADLGGSSKYSNENFEGEEERFHVSGTCTWPAHPGSGSAVGSSGWKSTAASRGVGAFPALENPEDRVRSRPVVLITHQVSKVNSLWSMEQCRQGSRQNGSVTGKGLALRAGLGGPSTQPDDCWRAA